jgi:hypothetical protein
MNERSGVGSGKRREGNVRGVVSVNCINDCRWQNSGESEKYKVKLSLGENQIMPERFFLLPRNLFP